MNFKEVFILLIVFNQTMGAQQQPEVVYDSFTSNNKMDSDGWSVAGAPNQVTIWKGRVMLGGDNVFSAQAVASKAFQLPSHKSMQLIFTCYLFNAWENEEIDIFVDDKLVQSVKFDKKRINQIFMINVGVAHTAPTAIIVFTSNLQDKNKFWGFGSFILKAQICGAPICSDDPNDMKRWNFVAISWRGLDANKFGGDGWETNGKDIVTTTCGGVPLFGGYGQTAGGIVISKVFKLPPHYKLKITVLWAKIDSWNNKAAQIKVDGIVVWQRNFQQEDGYFGKICGNSVVEQKSMFIRTEVDFDHSGDNAKIEFTTTLDQDSNQESFGLRDFNIFNSACSLNCAQCKGPLESQCIKCATNWYLYNGKCAELSNFIIFGKYFFETTKMVAYQEWVSYISMAVYCNYDERVYVIDGDVSAEKTLVIPPHRRLRIQASVFWFDDWNGEQINIKVDGNVIWSQEFNSLFTYNRNCFYRVSYDKMLTLRTKKQDIDQIFDHKSENAAFSITSTLKSKQSWGLQNLIISFEPIDTCAVVYSQCFFKGIQTRICTKTPNFKRNDVPLSFKSIRIPPQGRLTLFEGNDYFGNKVTYTSDQTCLDNFEFSQIYLSGQVEGGWVELEQ